MTIEYLEQLYGELWEIGASQKTLNHIQKKITNIRLKQETGK